MKIQFKVGIENLTIKINGVQKVSAKVPNTDYYFALSSYDLKTYSDVKKTCLSPESVVDMLNNQLDRLNMPEKNRVKLDANTPIISGKNIPVSDGDIDINAFIN